MSEEQVKPDSMYHSSHPYFSLLVTLCVKERDVSSWLGSFNGILGCKSTCSGPEQNEQNLFLSVAEQGFNGLVEIILYCKGS